MFLYSLLNKFILLSLVFDRQFIKGITTRTRNSIIVNTYPNFFITKTVSIPAFRTCSGMVSSKFRYSLRPLIQVDKVGTKSQSAYISPTENFIASLNISMFQGVITLIITKYLKIDKK